LTLYSFVSGHWPISASPISSIAFRVRMSFLLYAVSLTVETDLVWIIRLMSTKN
jgi:hypothetical protein